MNDAVLWGMKHVVEEAVQPVRATMARKRRMREELLAHLVTIVEEEAGKLGDEPAALERARQRFGDPQDISRQLQQAVPAWDRCRSILENMGCQPGESAWHLAGRHFLVMLTIYAIPFLPISVMLVLGGLPNMGPPDAQRILARAFFFGLPLIAAFNVILSLIAASLIHKRGPALASQVWGRILLGVLCVCLLPSAFMLPALAGAMVVFVSMARQAVKQWQYETDWA